MLSPKCNVSTNSKQKQKQTPNLRSTDWKSALTLWWCQKSKIYIFISEIYKWFSFLFLIVFSIRNKKHFLCYCCGNTGESLGEFKKVVDVVAFGSCSHRISWSTKLPFYFYNLIETRNIFICASQKLYFTKAVTPAEAIPFCKTGKKS